MNAALASSTKTIYKHTWDQFNLFSVTNLDTVVIPPRTVPVLISDLFHKKFVPTTI
jgi:hypothetical protein